MKKEHVFKSFAIILAVLVTFNFFKILAFLSIEIQPISKNPFLSSIVFHLMWTGPVILTALFVLKKNFIKVSGVSASVLKGFGIAALSCLPMYIIFAFAFQFNNNIEGIYIFKNALMAGFFEELVYRSLFFGSLYGVLKWKFWPAVLANAAIFSVGHLYQANDYFSSFMTILITSIGAVWFAWLYIRWNYNIWIPMFLHTLMNLGWFIFSVADGTAGGGITGYAARVVVIIISVALTLRYTQSMQPIQSNSEKKESNSSANSLKPVSV